MKNMRETRKFHLKPFSLSHHRSTMKVGTDAILLGLWAETAGVGKILEVGTGCGIISLLTASRCSALIDAIELDAESADEAGGNFDRSPFSYRMKAIHADFNRYSKSYPEKYDLIVSNPPFFINDMPSNDLKQRQTRHQTTLSYEQLLKGSVHILSPGGKLCVVLPYNNHHIFIDLAKHQGMFPQRQQLIFPFRNSRPNRINLCLGFQKPEEPATQKFIIREADKLFSAQYVELLKDYYIGLK